MTARSRHGAFLAAAIVVIAAASTFTLAAVQPLPNGVVEKAAVVGGVTINYKIAGQGPVIVLLHGYTQTSHMWLPLIPALMKSHTVIAPDLRGAGGSERTMSG